MATSQSSSTPTHVPAVPKPRLSYAQFVAHRAQPAACDERPTVADLIHRYVREIDPIKTIGESHKYCLLLLSRMPIGAKVADELTAQDIIEHCRTRRAEGVIPATVSQDLTYLRGPLGYASVGWGMKDVSVAPIAEAQPMLDKLQLAGKSRPRDRRPSVDEFALIHAYVKKQDADPRAKCQLAVMMEFAVASCRRRGEITRLLWSDLNEADRTLMVRDMKDPRMKKGNHFTFPLLGRAWEIVIAQPRIPGEDRIFPYNAKSAGVRFTDAKAKLGVKGLRFHDLRREGICQLFEQGFAAQEVAAVSGHKNWAILARVYANKFDPTTLHKGPAALRAQEANAGRRVQAA